MQFLSINYTSKLGYTFLKNVNKNLLCSTAAAALQQQKQLQQRSSHTKNIIFKNKTIIPNNYLLDLSYNRCRYISNNHRNLNNITSDKDTDNNVIKIKVEPDSWQKFKNNISPYTKLIRLDRPIGKIFLVKLVNVK